MDKLLHPYPETLEAEARRYAAKIAGGIPVMLAEHEERSRHAEADAFMELAEQGAWSYWEMLTKSIESGTITMDDLDKADLVATAVGCAGWIAAPAAGRKQAMAELVEDGVFTFHDRVPDVFIACYRLTVGKPR